MKYTKPYSELEEFKAVDVITTSTTGGGSGDQNAEPDWG